MTLFKDMVWKEVCSDVQGTTAKQALLCPIGFWLTKRKKKDIKMNKKKIIEFFYKLKWNKTPIIIMSKHFLAIILIFPN